MPIAIINKGLPGPGLLAQITASKYADHLPLHRLERILARHVELRAIRAVQVQEPDALTPRRLLNLLAIAL